MIEISHLQTVVAVAHHGSFSMAAEKLGITQSAISQCVKSIETKLGAKVFERAGKKMILTAEGERLFDLASSILPKIDETIEHIKHDKSQMAGRIKIGTLTGIGKSWLASDLAYFSKENPHLSIHISLGFKDELIADFNNHKLDILILPEYDLPPVGEKIFLSEERVSLVFPKTADFKIDENTTLEELSKYPCVFFESSTPIFAHWCKEYYGKVPDNIRPRFVINSHGNMLLAVSMGLGLAVVPTHVLERSYFSDKVSTLGKNAEVVSGKFFIVHHEGARDIKRIDAIIDRLLKSDNPLENHQ